MRILESSQQEPEIITVAEFLPLIFNHQAEINTDGFDLGSFLERNGFKRDLTQISLQNIQEHLNTLPRCNPETDFSESMFLTAEEMNEVFYSVNGLGYTEQDTISLSSILYLVQNTIFTGKMLSNIKLPLSLLQKTLFKSCTLENCEFSSDGLRADISMIGCKLVHISLLFCNQLTIKNCSGSFVYIGAASDISIDNTDIEHLTVASCAGKLRLERVVANHSVFDNNHFYDLYVYSVSGLNPDNCQYNSYYNKNSICASSAWDRYIYRYVNAKNSAPNIVVSYDQINHASVETLVQYYLDNRCNIIYLNNQRPFAEALAQLDNLRVDLVLLPGGEHVAPEYYATPRYYGNESIPDTNPRTAFELNLVRWAEANRYPIMGICRGMQLLAVYYGMRLIDLADPAKHCQDKELPVLLGQSPNNLLYYVCTTTFNTFQALPGLPITKFYDMQSRLGYKVRKNCIHSQCVDPSSLNDFVDSSVSSADGVIEYLQFKNAKGSESIGFQSHPERITEDLIAQNMLEIGLIKARSHFEEHTRSPLHRPILYIGV